MQRKIINQRFYNQTIAFFEDKIAVYEELIKDLDEKRDREVIAEFRRRISAANDSLEFYRNYFIPERRKEDATKSTVRDLPTIALVKLTGKDQFDGK